MKSAMPANAVSEHNKISNKEKDKDKDKDDRVILIAISVLACFLQDVLHEGLGHGVTAWVSGGPYHHDEHSGVAGRC